MKRWAVLAVLVALAECLGGAAFAGTPSQSDAAGSETSTGGSVRVTQAENNGPAARDSHHESPYSECHIENLWSLQGPFGLDIETGAIVQVCTRKADGGKVRSLYLPTDPRPLVTADAVASAQAQLALPEPEIGTAPPRDGVLLVGVETWFWARNDRPANATASIPGLSATITASPKALHLRFPDGTSITCPGGGSAWAPGRSGRSQHSDCTHIFQRAGDQAVRATLDWDLSWTATNGESGSLPAVHRVSDIHLPLRQAQATTD